MGSLSGVARHLAAALQDSATRVELARFMKDSSAGLLGVNLDACDQDRMSKRLFRAGEEHGAGSSAAACSAARRLNGLSLYMDPSRLADWDGTTIPIVTAIAEMQRPLPRAFHGYRSPRTMIDLPSDGSLQGPIFVVLPVAHPARAKEQARNDHPVQIITLPDPPVPDSVTSRPH